MPKQRRFNQLIRTITLIALMAVASSWAQDPAATTPPADPNAAPPAPPVEKPPEKPLYASTMERDNTLLANETPLEIQWLETPNEKFIALFKEGETRKAKGTLLILHAPELPQLWPAPLESLRRNLPIYGWETMTIPLPQKYPTVAPARESSSASSVEGGTAASDAASSQSSSEPSSSAEAASQSSASSESSSAPPLPREQLIGERVEAGVTYLNKKGQFNIVVLVDNSSAPFGLDGLYKKINAATSNPDTVDGPLQALVIVNLQGYEPLTKEQLEAIFSSENLPIMDVFFDPDNSYQQAVRRLHHGVAMRKNVKDYQQLILPPEHRVTVGDKQGFWLEKVRGFMERKAEGTELKKTNTTN